MTKYIIKNGTVFYNGSFSKQHLVLEGTKITQILAPDVVLENEATYELIDATGKHIFPGFIDLHVHLREPGFEYKETIKTGTAAAAAGGFTQVYAMPNTNPVMDSVAAVETFNTIAAKDAVVKVKTYGAITTGLRSETLVDAAGLANAGIVAFTNDGVGVQTSSVMYEAMQAAAKLNLAVTAHCEDDSLIYGGAFHQGKRAAELGVPGIPNICESVQIARDVLLAEAANCHYHVCHVSTKESVRVIRDAKKAGIRVTAEVTPHHLLLTENDIPNTNYENYKMNPPLRSQADYEALHEGLLDGTLDCIATDHAPHSIDDKNKPITQSAFGIIGSEHAFALLYTKFVRNGTWTLEQLVNWMSTKPAAVYGLEGGCIKENAPADLAIFDLRHAYEIEPPFVSKSSNTPFLGQMIFGKTIMTFVDGHIAYDQTTKSL